MWNGRLICEDRSHTAYTFPTTGLAMESLLRGIVCSYSPPSCCAYNDSDHSNIVHDWERIIVIWRRENNQWFRKELLKSFHTG